MKRDPFVIAAVLVMAAFFLGTAILERVKPTITESSVGVMILFFLTLVAVVAFLRIFVLFFQTLSHVIHTPWVRHRGLWILGHLALGPIVSIPYYFVHQVERLRC